MQKIVSLADKRESVRLESIYDDLPAPNTKRWVVRRKAAVVNAVDAGVLSKDAALRRYNLSEEELESWRTSLAKHGVPALYATRVQLYRNSHDE